MPLDAQEPIAIRASSLSLLFDCPAHWAAKHLEGKQMPTSSRALLGKAIHASTATYDQAVIDGDNVSIDDAAAAAVDAIQRPDEEVIWSDDDNPRAMEGVALSLHRRYCMEIAPQQIYVAVEAKCERLVFTDIGIALTGTVDRVRLLNDGHGIADLKSGKSAVSAAGEVATSGHALQMGSYELLAEHACGISITAPAQIIGMQTGKTPAGQRIGTGLIHGARDLLIGDGETPGALEVAAKLIRSGLFYGNPKSMLCGQKFCPIYQTCKYRR